MCKYTKNYYIYTSCVDPGATTSLSHMTETQTNDAHELLMNDTLWWRAFVYFATLASHRGPAELGHRVDERYILGYGVKVISGRR